MYFIIADKDMKVEKGKKMNRQVSFPTLAQMYVLFSFDIE